MEEIKVKSNCTNLDVYINGFPDLDEIPTDVLELLVFDISVQIEALFTNKRTKKSKDMKMESSTNSEND